MSLAGWSLFIGALLLVLVVFGTWLSRLPLSSAMLYLVVGVILGPAALGLLTPDPVRNAPLLERATEAALLVSLFAVGLQLREPLRDRHWWLPLRLALVSMAATVAMVTAVGVWLLGLPIGAAVLLGAILAPTDPVLASGIRSQPGPEPDRLAFSLAGEGGLNDGAAFPFFALGLGLLGMHDLGPAALRWWSVDLLWATLGGLVLGWALGALAGRLVVYLRGHHHAAVGLDVFLGLGLVASAYGLAQLMLASGFLAVFAAGLSLQRVGERPVAHSPGLEETESPTGHSYETLATHSHHASATMRDAVQLFNGQLEKLVELGVVLLLGAMLAYARPLPALWWFVPLLLLVIRPVSTLPATIGERLSRPESALLAWFGIRGVGSIFYLMLALRHGLDADVADVLISLTLWTVATSILVHGLTAQPLMRWYGTRRTGVRRARCGAA